MEAREDLRSILPFIPLILRSSSLFWPSKAQDALRVLALGPDVSNVSSGVALFDAILRLRDSVGLSYDSLASNASRGYVLFFDELMSRVDSRTWFGDVVPRLASFLLRLPSLLEAHYRSSDEKFEGNAGLRLMAQQEAGIVCLSQELIVALLACALFCLFPMMGRGGKHLPPTINLDYLFASLHWSTMQSQEQKIKCLIHYFERVCLCMPMGLVSFERKVIPLEPSSDCIAYPQADFWKNSAVPLCPFEVFSRGFIEDQQQEALEVDFANEFLGGGALHRGCVQEEIRFMINPELIVGMLFMASMQRNEAIEIIGTERFSSYNGYGSSFRFMGDFLDKKPVDSVGRRKTRIVAIDALDDPRRSQYKLVGLLRETNKAFIGFFDQMKYEQYIKIFQHTSYCENLFCQKSKEDHFESHGIAIGCDDTSAHPEGPNIPDAPGEEYMNNLELSGKIMHQNCLVMETLDIGIATGNWGCGAFGGDPEIKSIIQWLAASQALRPFIHYYTFGEAALQRLQQVTRWILLHGWTVGDLWSILIEYSAKRSDQQTNLGFLSWVLPVLNNNAEASKLHA